MDTELSIKPSIEYIKHNLKTTITAEELAKMAGYPGGNPAWVRQNQPATAGGKASGLLCYMLDTDDLHGIL